MFVLSKLKSPMESTQRSLMSKYTREILNFNETIIVFSSRKENINGTLIIERKYEHDIIHKEGWIETQFLGILGDGTIAKIDFSHHQCESPEKSHLVWIHIFRNDSLVVIDDVSEWKILYEE